MTELFLVLLASAWLVLLGPASIRARRATPLFTAERFKRRMQSMAPQNMGSAGRWVLAPPSSGAADRSARRAEVRSRRRRKMLLLVLAAVAVALLVVAIAMSGPWWSAFAGSVACLVVYVVLLVQARKRREESTRKVRSLERRRAGEGPLFEDLHERRA